jgi:hypothetical protein
VPDLLFEVVQVARFRDVEAANLGQSEGVFLRHLSRSPRRSDHGNVEVAGIVDEFVKLRWSEGGRLKFIDLIHRVDHVPCLANNLIDGFEVEYLLTAQRHVEHFELPSPIAGDDLHQLRRLVDLLEAIAIHQHPESLCVDWRENNYSSSGSDSINEELRFPAAGESANEYPPPDACILKLSVNESALVGGGLGSSLRSSDNSARLDGVG